MNIGIDNEVLDPERETGRSTAAGVRAGQGRGSRKFQEANETSEGERGQRRKGSGRWKRRKRG